MPKTRTFLAFSMLCSALFCGRVAAQTHDTEFAPEADESVFHIPTWAATDPFGEISRYRLGTLVRYRERGLDSRHFRVLLGGIDLADNISPYPDYTLFTLLRRSGLEAEQRPAMTFGVARHESYSLAPAGDAFYVMLRAGDRYSRGGGDIRHHYAGPSGWSYTIAATGEGGADGHIEGVFTNALGGVATVSKEWKGGARVTLLAAGGTSERGVRTAATEEAFTLTGDRHYNPVWGLQNDFVRNSRTNGIDQLLGAVQIDVPLGPKTTMSLVASLRRALGSRSRLAWLDTHSPLPDYYRSMPSFYPDWQAAEMIADEWRAGNPDVTQVNWTDFYYNNTLAEDGRATYFVEDQMERTGDANFVLSIDHRPSDELSISYGIRAEWENARYFKQAGDLLGAQWVPNIDQYVTDPTDGEYHTELPNENDLRNPGRQVRQGERFGYDYGFTRLRPSVFGELRWGRQNHGLAARASVTRTRLWREGFYEKELFPGEGSFGRSAQRDFTTFSASMSAYWNPSPRHSLSLAALASTEAPFADDVFLSPQQNSMTIDDPTSGGLYGAEFAWAFVGEGVSVHAAAFVNAQTGETDIRRYYDDLAGTFADMAVGGIDRLGMGIELGVEVQLARPLTFSAGGSVGDFRYNSEPVATIFEDATGRVISDGVVCYLSGLRTGIPQLTAGAELEYSDRRYWRVSLYGEWLGGRHVEINPLYHSQRIVGINSAPEIMEMFTGQERLPDAFTLGASVSKGWPVGRGYLRIAGAVRNLLSSVIPHSGYEQMRIRRLGTGLERTLVPFPAKYMYTYPMTWSLTLSYRL